MSFTEKTPFLFIGFHININGTCYKLDLEMKTDPKYDPNLFSMKKINDGTNNGVDIAARLLKNAFVPEKFLTVFWQTKIWVNEKQSIFYKQQLYLAKMLVPELQT